MSIHHPQDSDRTLSIDIVGLSVRLFQDDTLIAIRNFISVEGMWRYLSANGWV